MKSFRLRIIIIFALFAVVFGIAIYLVADRVISSGFYRVEKSDYETKMTAIDNAIKTEKDILKGQNLDWAAWDDSYNFVTNKNEDYITVNINPEMLNNLKIDFFVILGQDYEPVFMQVRNNDGKEIRTEADNRLTTSFQKAAVYYEKSHQSDNDTAEIFYDYNGTPVLTTVTHILRSDNSGPNNGYMLMGKYFNQDTIKSISEKSNLTLTLEELVSIEARDSYLAQTIRDQSIGYEFKSIEAYGYYLVKDYNDKSITVIKSTFSRYVNQTANNTKYFILISIYTVVIVALVLAFIIITKLAAARKKQFEGDAKYRMLFDENVMPLFLIKMGKNWEWEKITETNNAARNLFFIDSKSRLINHPLEILKGSAATIIQDFQRTLVNVGLSVSQVNLFIGGNFIPVELIGRMFTINDQKYVLLAIKDLSERVLYERKLEDFADNLKKFKLAVEHSSDQIVITTSDGVIIYANRSLETVTGFKPEEVLGEKAGTSRLWGGIMDKSFYEEMWRTISEEKKIFNAEIKNKKKNGREFDAFLSISPILSDKGEVIFYVGVERDITKSKEVDRAKTEFVSLASHQLRTPLSSIGWFTEMLLNEDAGKINKTQKEYLEEIYKGNKRMVDLVNSLLNVSRIDLSTFEVNPEPTNIVEICQDMIKELQPAIKQKQIKISEKYDQLPDIPLDKKLIRIVFQNFLTNSIKYSPPHGKVSVTITRDALNLLISVEDSGYGIPEEQKDKIFSKLFRADNVKAMDAEGTGLGLYIVKSIVEQSDGKVWFESKINEGTNFHVSLPLSGMKSKSGSKPLE